MHLKIGTRSSPLALAQTNIVINALKKHIDFSYEIVEVKTTGDLILHKPLYEIGGKSLFLKELEEALLSKKIDFAVHSLKDVPGEVDARFMLGCYLVREYHEDSFVSIKYTNIEELPSLGKIGTCSPRRAAFIMKKRKDLKILPLRGNINSRMVSLRNGNFDAIILAEVGLRRLSIYDSSYCHQINIKDMIPAVGQGVITCEILKENNALYAILQHINDIQTSQRVLIEREFLEYLKADCKTPVAAFVSSIEVGSKSNFMIGSNDLSRMRAIERPIEKFEIGLGEKIAKEITKDFVF